MLDRIPPNSLLLKDMPPGAYRDCCQVELPPGVSGIDEVVPAFFAAAPDWFHCLLALRNRLVAPFGLKTGSAMGASLPSPFRPGQNIGLFLIYEAAVNEIILGEDDRHLDFRISLQILAQPDGRRLAVSCWVSPHNLGGSLYFALVKPFHRFIVPIIARRTVRRLERRATP